jgi:hypothetical protein
MYVDPAGMLIPIPNPERVLAIMKLQNSGIKAEAVEKVDVIIKLSLRSFIRP